MSKWIGKCKTLNKVITGSALQTFVTTCPDILTVPRGECSNVSASSPVLLKQLCGSFLINYWFDGFIFPLWPSAPDSLKSLKLLTKSPRFKNVNWVWVSLLALRPPYRSLQQKPLLFRIFLNQTLSHLEVSVTAHMWGKANRCKLGVK